MGVTNVILLDAIYSSYTGRLAELHKLLITMAWHSSRRQWPPDMMGSQNTLNIQSWNSNSGSSQMLEVRNRDNNSSP
jgi:hypothetical protein